MLADLEDHTDLPQRRRRTHSKASRASRRDTSKTLYARRPYYSIDLMGRWDLQQLSRRYRLLADTAPLHRRVLRIYNRARHVTSLLAGQHVFTASSLEAEIDHLLAAGRDMTACRADLFKGLHERLSGLDPHLPIEARIWSAWRTIEWHLYPIVIALNRASLRKSFAVYSGKAAPVPRTGRSSPRRDAELDALVRDPAQWAPQRKPRAGFAERKLPALETFAALPDHLRAQPLTEADHAFLRVDALHIDRREPDDLRKLPKFPPYYPVPTRLDRPGPAFVVKSLVRALAWIDPASVDDVKITCRSLVALAHYSEHGSETLDRAICEAFVAWASPVAGIVGRSQDAWDAAVEGAFWNAFNRDDALDLYPRDLAGQLFEFSRQRAFRHWRYDAAVSANSARMSTALSAVEDPRVKALLPPAL